MFRALDPQKIVQTLEILKRRIVERFPDAGLGKVADELLNVARNTVRRTRSISRPNLPLRLVIIGLLAVTAWGAWSYLPDLDLRVASDGSITGDVVQTLESAVALGIYVALSILFLFSLENRRKRARALAAIHEIRSLAHVVDMHQLTKDPDTMQHPAQATASSPKRTMTNFELSRYLDYCSEMFSLMGKIAALYVQDFKDPVALQAVDDIETLTSGLSRKVWQKITMIPKS